MNRRGLSTQTWATAPASEGLTGLLQRQCACGTHVAGGGACSVCSKQKLALQRKLSIGQVDDPLEEEAERVSNQVMAMPGTDSVKHAPLRVQRFTGSVAEAATVAPASVERALGGSGQALESGVRREMEARFGHDFSTVRVHRNADAETSAREVDANAYTVGNDIVFGAGMYAPHTHSGKRLLAHELTHVLQQDSNPAGRNRLHRQVPHRGEAEADLSTRLNALISQDQAQGASVGPVQPEVVERAREFLRATRTILGDVQRDLNTLLHLMDGLSSFVSTDVMDGTLALTILYEGLDAVGIAVAEEAEGTVTLIAKTIKVIVATYQRKKEAEAANRRAASRALETATLYDLLVNGQTMVDELTERVQHEPNLANFFSTQPVPSVPRHVSTSISRELELRLMVSVLKRQGARVETEETDSITLDKTANPMDTDMNREAQRRHADPHDNFWLRRMHTSAEWSTLRAVVSWDASSGATGNTEYSWYYWKITGVSEEMITFILDRLSTIGISKDRLFTLMLGFLIRYR
jgi:hypothetical protein